MRPSFTLSRLNGNRRFDHRMQLPHDAGDVGRVAIFLKALVNDVDLPRLSARKSLTPLHRQARLKFVEDLTRHDLEALAGFVVFVDRILLPSQSPQYAETRAL